MLSLYYYRFHIHVKLINIIIGSTNKLEKFAPWTNLHWSPSLGFVHFFLLWKYHCSGNLKTFIGCFLPGLDLLWALLQSLQNDQNHLRQCTEDESHDGANRHPERCSFWWKCWGIFFFFFRLTFFLVRDYWKLQYNNRLWMVQIQESHFVAGHFHKAQWNVLSMNIKCKFPESNLWRSVKRYSTLGAFFFSDQLQKQRWKKPHFSITGSNKVKIYIKSWWLVYSRPALI